MIISHHQNSGKNENIKIVSESFENMEKFKYLWMTLKNQDAFYDEINSTLISRNACYYSVQNLLFSRLT